MICDETNRFNEQQVNVRAQQLRAKQVDRRDGKSPENLKIIRRRLRGKPAYGPHEILHMIGLLVSHMLCNRQYRFAAQWSMSDDGGVPAGIFGRYMSRNRFSDLLQDLHFVDNNAERPSRDKLWKLRPVYEKIQERFRAGWTLPARFSFDEGVLPATSKRNPTRMFMPDKPHRYGSKMFMTCDSRTAYCHRFELYVGKRETGDTNQAAFDNKTGAAAVIRNLKSVLSEGRHPFHLVVVDRFYSSVPLAIELLTMNTYVIGTCMTNRLGFDRAVVEKRQTRPMSIPRGTFKFSRSAAVPTLVAFHWWDKKPVHYLCTGATMAESVIRRNVKRIGPVTVPCPSAVNDYQRWMGGVDVHDQLRLQRYSLQTSLRLRKYYKALFLGFVDLAMVNSYISHKETARINGTPAMGRSDWYRTLQNQLLRVKAEDFDGVAATPPPTSVRSGRARPKAAGHTLVQLDDWMRAGVLGTQKRRQRACKVCALLRGERKKSYQTTWYCEKCSADRAKCYLCPKVRRDYLGVAKTCFQIWHDDFDCGKSIPSSLGKRVVLRRPKDATAGKRKKTRRELTLDERNEDGSDNNSSDDSDRGDDGDSDHGDGMDDDDDFE